MEKIKKIFMNLPIVKSIIRPLLVNPKIAQEEIDIYRAAILLTGNLMRRQLNRPFSESDVESLYKKVESLRFSEMKSGVNGLINDQIIKIFEQIDEINLSVEQEQIIRKDRKSFISENLLCKIGYYIESKPSNISKGGDGLYIRGNALPGDVISMYPGLVHLPEYTQKAGYLESLLPDDDLFLMSRMDGTLIDARTSFTPSHSPSLSSSNPYAMAHLINHPPVSCEPNVLQIAYDFPGDPLEIEQFPPDLQYLIPNQYAKPPTLLGTIDRSACMRGLVTIAVEPLSDGQELYMDYRLNPMAPVPDWYAHVNKEQASRRWDPQSFNKNVEKLLN